MYKGSQLWSTDKRSLNFHGLFLNKYDVERGYPAPLIYALSVIYYTNNSTCNDSVLIKWSSDYNLVSHVTMCKMRECVGHAKMNRSVHLTVMYLIVH